MTNIAEDIWPLRSMLFVPGQKLDWIRKSSKYGPDALIIDLEDAVPPAGKTVARETTRDGIAHCRSIGLAATVRINHPSEGGLDDIAAVTSPGLVAVVVPKLRRVEEIREIDRALSHAEGKAGLPLGAVGMVILPETAEGLRDAGLLAAASTRVRGIMGGFSGAISGDVARAMGFRPTFEGIEQQYLASKMVLDSRSAGADFPICVVMGTRLDDLDSVRMLARRGRQFGFSGCALIHPSHVAVANEVFLPTKEEIAHASGLIAAMESGETQGSGAVAFQGMMVDYAMVAPAKAILREARRRGLA